MNTFVWIDLGVKELDRAVQFYSQVFGKPLSIEQFEEFRFAVFSHGDQSVSGCLVPKIDFVPVPESTLIYLNVNGRMAEAIEAVSSHGGKVINAPHSIGPHGTRAIILDSEGNHIALHAQE